MVSGNDQSGVSDSGSIGSPRAGDLDGFLTVLADARRREIVRSLAAHERGMSPGALADTLLDDEECQECRLRSGLRHQHLPRLEDHGFIERGEDGTIYATERCAIALDVLESIEDHFVPHAVV